jgi:transcriptional regulator with PAS, ATPase and Fis domain
MASKSKDANDGNHLKRGCTKSFPEISAMTQNKSALQTDSGYHSVSVSPLVELARCVTTEDTLQHLARIITNKGIALQGIRLVRAGLSREWKAQETSTLGTEIQELEAQVEGGQTRLCLLFSGIMSPDARCEIEGAANMAAQRIELCERRLWMSEEARGKQSTPEIPNMIGNSGPMQSLKRSIKVAAQFNSTTLIIGESGTGKELAARAIHSLGSRADKPFIAVNCGAFTEALLESELFGYVKGAFTGALTNHKGLFEAANRGTIFLDEIGEMPRPMQVKLLRVLQERKVRPIGAHDEIDVDVRIIAATNRNLQREVEERRFREDLYYRLHVLVIRMPPLKERRLDISMLIRHFLKTTQQKLKHTSPIELEETALQALCGYHWPGNVRELQNMIERLAAEIEDSRVITIEQVIREIRTVQLAATSGDEIEYKGVLRAGEPLDDHLNQQQLKIYELVRAHVGGNHSQAARWLGIERTALYHRLERARQRTGADH